MALDLGLRYERIGQFNDALGRNSSFDIGHADPNPPSTGSVAGYVVAANYSGVLPAGVIRAGNDAANFGQGQNGLAPRIGFAWRPLSHTSRLVVRSGYGIYFSRPTGQAFFQSVFGAPFSLGRVNIGEANAAATLSNPFSQPFPMPGFFPYFPPYSPTSDVTISTVSPDFRSEMIQQHGLNLQAELAKDWIMEVGYVGTQGTHLLRFRSPNQALSASPADPIRGTVSNTVANIGLRAPVQGVPPDSLNLVESAGSSSYNALEASLSERFNKGLQLLGSYTFSQTLDTDPSNIKRNFSRKLIDSWRPEFAGAALGKSKLWSDAPLGVEWALRASFSLRACGKNIVGRLVCLGSPHPAIRNGAHDRV